MQHGVCFIWKLPVEQWILLFWSNAAWDVFHLKTSACVHILPVADKVCEFTKNQLQNGQ